VRPTRRTAFKITRGSSVLLVGQPQPQPFKYFALDVVGYLGKLPTLILSTTLEVFFQLHAPTDLPLVRKPLYPFFI